MPSLSSPSFARLVSALKKQKKTITVIESSCGGLINASILSVPGASAVYYGGSVAYNSRRGKPLLLNNSDLHSSLTATPSQKEGTGNNNTAKEDEKENYIASKFEWTTQTALAFCRELETDFCIAEGGATGPTFRPQDLHTGFAVIAIAARRDNGSIEIAEQTLIESNHADRERNMRFFADQAAELALKALVGPEEQTIAQEQVNSKEEEKPHFDRATHLRKNQKALDGLSRKAQHVVLHQDSALFQKTPSNAKGADLHNRRLKYVTADEVESICRLTGATKRTTFLGMLNDRDPVFGVDLIFADEKQTPDPINTIESILPSITEDPVQFENTRTVAPLLIEIDNELVMHATALAQWQRRAPFCMRCGSPTALVEGGNSRTCTSCGDRSWPRQDPSMIAVVSNRDGSKVLLGSSKRHPPGMHSSLAGFVEAGESMERAVAREVFEETGIRVDEDSVRYVASQPWPFPQSTMIGFTVKADDSQPLNIDEDELVGAAWFDKSQVRMAAEVAGPVMQKDVAEAALAQNPNLELLIPPKGVLGRTLIDEWLSS